MNFDLFNYNNPLSECFNSHNFTQITGEPASQTRYSSISTDRIYVNNRNKGTKYGIVNVDIVSNHKVVIYDVTIGTTEY